MFLSGLYVDPWNKAITEGARAVENVEVVIKRVPELTQRCRTKGRNLDQEAPIATIDELPHYDAIIFGPPARFGNMCSSLLSAAS